MLPGKAEERSLFVSALSEGMATLKAGSTLAVIEARCDIYVYMICV